MITVVRAFLLPGCDVGCEDGLSPELGGAPGRWRHCHCCVGSDPECRVLAGVRGAGGGKLRGGDLVPKRIFLTV